jgi:hypothetical protein
MYVICFSFSQQCMSFASLSASGASDGVQERGTLTKKHEQKDEEGRHQHRILMQLKDANKTPVAVHS